MIYCQKSHTLLITCIKNALDSTLQRDHFSFLFIEPLLKPGNFEIHDQFIMELGLQFLSNAFEHFLETTGDTLDVQNEADAEELILDFLAKYEIKFFYEPDNCEEKDKFDDLLSYAKDLCSRTVLSVIFDKLEEESDAFGLRAFRISMIIYFLNRKQEVQDSKYAYSLLLDLVQELNSSERTQKRMENIVCVNVKGLPGEGIHRDKKCEHFVKGRVQKKS